MGAGLALVWQRHVALIGSVGARLQTGDDAVPLQSHLRVVWLLHHVGVSLTGMLHALLLMHVHHALMLLRLLLLRLLLLLLLLLGLVVAINRGRQTSHGVGRAELMHLREGHDVVHEVHLLVYLVLG